MQLVGTFDTALYTAVKLQVFYSKIEKQVILGRTRSFFNLCDMILIAKIFK